MNQFACITAETASLRDEYPSLAALEAGDVNVWVQERYEQLVSQATQNRTTADAAKVLNLTVMGVSTVAMTSTPFGWVTALMGGGFWIYAVVEDFFDTGRFHPLPFVRLGWMDLLTQGDADERDWRRVMRQQSGMSEDSVEELRLISYLPRREEIEARMLFSSMRPIVGILTQVDAGKRFHAYRWLITEFKRRGGFSHLQPSDIDAQMSASLPDPQHDYAAIAAYRQGTPKTPPPPPTPEQLAAVGQLAPYTPGPTTQLGAITVPAQSSSPEIADAQEMDRWRGVGPATIDGTQYLMDFAARPKHLYVVALSGAGKGMWLSNYVRWRKQAEPGLIVFWIDPKNDTKETGYFAETWIKAFRFKAATMEIADLIVELQAAFSEYVDFVSKLPDGAPVLLIVDECLLVQHILDEHGKAKSEKSALKTQIVRAASVGDGDNKHITCVSQSPNAGDSGVSAGILRGLRKVILFRGDELDVVHQAKDCGAISEALPSDAELKRLCRHSPINRGIYLNGQYHSLPELTNYSGYDRDSRTWIDESKNPVNRLTRQFNQPAKARPQLNGAEELSVADLAFVELPKGVSEEVSNKMLGYLVSWLDAHKDLLPIAQSKLATSSNNQVKGVAKVLGSKRWILMIKYWAAIGKIALEGSDEKGYKVSVYDLGDNEREIKLTDLDF